MIFQPTSPIRHFHILAPRRSQKKDQALSPSKGSMTSTRAPRASDKTEPECESPRQSQKMMFDDTATIETLPAATLDEVCIMENPFESQGSSHSSRTLVAVDLPPFRSGAERRNTTETTNSSPTDPAYIPHESDVGGLLAQRREPPEVRLPISIAPTRTADQSFFDSDTGSDDDDEPVIGRASSVRISKPNVVVGGPNLSRRGTLTYGRTLTVDGRAVSPSSSRYSEVSESTSYNDNPAGHGHNGPAKALQLLEGSVPSRTTENVPSIELVQSPVSNLSSLSAMVKQGGLFMNPVTNNDRVSIQRAISAPSLPYKVTAHKKVTIRPSDLIIEHSMGGRAQFRETVVTTPYPILKEEDEDDDGTAGGDGGTGDLTALPEKSGPVKTTRFSSDRFPSPDRSEVLFLNLGLANRPSSTTTLEIRIANKASHDDEMLFQQIRAAYRNRVLGKSRFPFCIIRGVSHATISSTAQDDFESSDFMKHFKNPRVGRRRKTWVIWLRHYSRQRSSVYADHSSIVRRPVSSLPIATEKGLSEQSDSTSTINVSFMPRMMLPRIPFFNKEVSAPSPVLTYGCPPEYGVEDGSDTVKIKFHHAFSFWALATLSSLVMFSSVAAAVVWVMFGVPGSRPGDAPSEAPGAALADRLAWATAAQSRVLTGLVLAITVALLGAMMELCLVGGAYILL